MAGVPAGRQAVEGQDEIVSVWSRECDPSLELRLAESRQRCPESPRPCLFRRQAVAAQFLRDGSVSRSSAPDEWMLSRLPSGRGMVLPGDRRIRELDLGSSSSIKVGARLDDLRPEGDEPFIPDVERAELAAPSTRECPRRLQQRVALPKHAVVVREHAAHAAVFAVPELIQKPAAAGWLAPNQRQVFRREQHAREISRQLSGLDRGAIDLGTIRADPIQLHLDEHGCSPLRSRARMIAASRPTRIIA